MHGETDAETGWSFVIEGNSVPTLIHGLLQLDPGEQYTRSELADATGVPLKTLHLSEDLETAVELGVVERHDPEDPDGEQVAYTVSEDSEVLERAREFGEAVVAARSE